MDRDNQQVRDISWLAGILDGEGCFLIYRRQRGKSFDLIPEITFNNSNWLIIEKADIVLKDLKVGHFISSIGKYGTRPHKKPMWSIRVTGWFRCKSLLVEIIDYLIGKRREAELLHWYICSRLLKPQKCAPYSNDEIKAYEVLKKLKEMSNPNDYTLNIFTDKMKI